MAERNITSVDLLESVTNKTNAIVEENGTLNKVNLHNEFNTINTKIDNEVNTLSNNIAQLSNPNLLINSDWRTCGMTCVNQRGLSNYVGHWQNRVYTIDRWHIGGGSNQMSVKCNSYSITLTSTGTTYQWFGQVLEQGLKEGTYTISVNVKSMTSSTYVLFDNNYFDLQVGLNTFTVTTKTSIDNIYIILHSAGTTELEYIKLEQGSIATPLVPKSYAEELALCQRYYRCMHAAWLNLVNCIVTSSTNLKYQLPFEMRVLPTVTFSHPSWTIGDMATANKNVTITSMEVIQYFLDITISSGHGLTKGQVCTLTVGGSESTAGLEFDAEIY